MANIPRISIDYIVVTIPVDQEQQKEVQGQMEHALTLYQNSLESQRPQGRYRFSYLLSTPNGEGIQIEAQPTREGYNYIRVEYSPDQIGPEGAECLADYLSNVLGTAYRDSFYGGRLQKMVVSFDLYDVELDDLWIYRTGSREKQTAMIFNADLGLESICIGYDSARQLSFSQAERPSPDTQPCVRVEYIHDKGNYTLSDFYVLLENPLRSLTIRRYAEFPGLMDHVQSKLFFDAVRLKGKKRILEMYSDDEQESMQAAMKRFPMITESKLRLAIWLQLRGSLETLLPPIPAESDEAIAVL